MAKTGGGGMGFVMAIVVLVIVLLLSAKAWNAVMPTAQQALAPGGSPRQVDDHGQKEVGDQIRSGALPNLRQLGTSTDQHIQQVKDAAGKQD
ncbi:MAG TPA: hypothetical protein VFQ07_16570 [Candidatus Polarisedimenticolia bacterium]|nr:hypothetical protein [Candidatus Polarisedimenticolia bacterium]